EQSLVPGPLLEKLMDVGIAAELLEEDIDFQGLELRPTEVSIDSQIGIVEVEDLLGQLLVTLPDLAPVVGVELEQGLEEGEVLPDGFLPPSHSRSHPPKIRKEGR